MLNHPAKRVRALPWRKLHDSIQKLNCPFRLSSQRGVSSHVKIPNGTPSVSLIPTLDLKLHGEVQNQTEQHDNHNGQ